MTMRIYSGAFLNIEESSIPKSTLTNIRSAIRAAGVTWNGIRERARKRRMLADMRTLSNHTLRDIGVSRSELTSFVYDGSGERRRSHVGR